MVAIVAIGSMLAAFMIIGVGVYMMFPPNYTLYNSNSVQNMTAGSLQAATTIDLIVHASPYLLLGAVFIAGIAMAVRARGGFE